MSRRIQPYACMPTENRVHLKWTRDDQTIRRTLLASMEIYMSYIAAAQLSPAAMASKYCPLVLSVSFSIGTPALMIRKHRKLHRLRPAIHQTFSLYTSRCDEGPRKPPAHSVFHASRSAPPHSAFTSQMQTAQRTPHHSPSPALQSSPRYSPPTCSKAKDTCPK